MSFPKTAFELPSDETLVPQNKAVIVVNWLLEAAAAVTMGGLAILVFCNALGRYLFSAPLPWTEEMVLNMLLWLAAIGVTMAGLRGQLVSCDIVTARMKSPKMRRLLAFACAMIGTATMLYCCWLTVQYLQIFGKTPSLLLGIPKGLAIAALLFSFIGVTASLIVSLFSRR